MKHIPLSIGTALIGVTIAVAAAQAGDLARKTAPRDDLWAVYDSSLANAKYIDLTHAFSPDTPIGPDFAPLRFMTARGSAPAGQTGTSLDYATVGAAITAYELSTDQIGTQLDPPAHGNPQGATISDFPPTVAVRPLVVIDMSAKTKANPATVAEMADVRAWEARNGPIPAGSVVMFRTDWSKRWPDAAAFNAKPFPGVSLEALKYLHLQRHILFHGHEPYNADMSPTYATEKWLFENNFTQAEGVANLDKVPERGALVAIGFAKPEGGTGGFARFVAIVPSGWRYGTTISEEPGAPLVGHKNPLMRDRAGVLREPATPADK
ncbi:MAG: cyclase family protein [Alphaproteobacteria bacterium]|nr:cyclase family protein [Alphaproteobacteria bacterium]